MYVRRRDNIVGQAHADPADDDRRSIVCADDTIVFDAITTRRFVYRARRNKLRRLIKGRRHYEMRGASDLDVIICVNGTPKTVSRTAKRRRN